jgi:CheY-like chemotaxis protein
MPLLFERFQRDETGNSRGQDGFGLGLMLVRHLCELHRGSVVASSAGANLGASFIVRLPLRGLDLAALSSLPVSMPVVHGRPSAERIPEGLGGLRLLLVDDHLESRDALAVLLAQAGAMVEVLSSGSEAVQRLDRRLPPGEREPPPDVLICDIAMPGLDGHETLRQIRRDEQSSGARRLPAIALTAFARNDDRVRAHDAGFEMHLSKPVDVVELIQTLAAFMHQRSG